MNLVHNERVKLTATAVDNLALAFAVAGFVAPIVAFSPGLTNAPTVGYRIILVSVVWLSTAGGLHLFARWLLEGLKP